MANLKQKELNPFWGKNLSPMFSPVITVAEMTFFPK